MIINNSYITNSPEETFNLGMRIAVFLCKGSVIALEGELGSGKTCLVKGIADALGIKETITSPTYTIISEYQFREQRADNREQLTENSEQTLYHIDAYRLENEEDFENIGGIELISGNGISIIEWSDKIKSCLPEDAISIKIEITGADSRLIKIERLEL